MTESKSIRQLYSLAMAEGEGVGTAYEYYAKRLALLPWLANSRKPQNLLVAGLPEKYGASLDLILLGRELGCHTVVVDDREAALSKLSTALRKLDEQAGNASEQPDFVQDGDLARLSGINGRFDLVVSSEVLQRFSPGDRRAYVGRLLALSPRLALFAPNADNDAHVGLSGLAGLRPEELEQLLQSTLHSEVHSARMRVGYIDMPPFPPGITRSDTQREEAATGNLEAMAMWGLTLYARGEGIVPTALKRRWAHIVYAFLEDSPR